MIDLLSKPINKKSQIDQKISQIHKKESKNNSKDIVRSMIDLLSQPINKNH